MELRTKAVLFNFIFHRPTITEETESEKPPDIFKGSLPDPMQLEWYKNYRENEAKTMSAFKSLIFFVLFLLILGIVCYGNREYHQYLMGREIKALFPRVEKASIYFLLSALYNWFQLYRVQYFGSCKLWDGSQLTKG